MVKALVPMHDQSPEPRRGILARVFGATDEQNAMERLRADHALARLEIELATDLKRHRRRAEQYLEVTALEDRAMKEIAKEQRRREILEHLDELFDDDPLTAELLKVRVRRIFNGHHRGHAQHRKR
jgi:hypothetical protein